jgi:tRNA G18 (ribose-2'-O)-methylase SpoU
MLSDFTLDKGQKYAVIFGNEVKGVQQEVVSASDYCVEIPQFGTKHSFNISVSVGIVLWDLFRKLNP